MPIEITGRGGEIRRGYRPAASLGAWTMAEKSRVKAELVSVEPFEWATDGPWVLRLRMGPAKVWIYRDVRIARRESPVIVEMPGPPEVREV